MGSKSPVCVVIVQHLKVLHNPRPRPRNRLIFMSNMKRPRGCQTRTDLGAKGCDYTHSNTLKVSKQVQPHFETLHCTYTLTPLIHLHMKHSLLEIQIFHLGENEKHVTAVIYCTHMCRGGRPLGEPLLCVVWCNAMGDGLLSFIYCAVVCIGGRGWGGRTEITAPSHISQRSGIQSSAVWHFSTDCWPAPPGVAHPFYLLPGPDKLYKA